jgi:hypothetical protein
VYFRAMNASYRLNGRSLSSRNLMLTATQG